MDKVAVVDPSLFSLPYDHELCQALAQEGCDVSLFGRALRQEESFPSAPKYKFYPFFYRSAEKKRSRKTFLMFKGLEHIVDMGRLVLEIRRMQVTALHIQWLPLPMVDMAWLGFIRGIPKVLTVHNITPFHDSPSASLQKVGWQRALNGFDKLIVHTRAGRDTLIAWGLDSSKIEIMPHPVLPTGDLPDAAEASSSMMRAEHQTKTVMIFGEIKPYKGIDVAIRALAKLSSRTLDKTRMVIAGKPKMDVGQLKKLAEEVGVMSNIEWQLGFQPHEELPQLLGGADIFLFPYRDIEASGVLAAVLPYGRPVIASNIGVFADTVEEQGYGLLVVPEDSEELAQKMEMLLTHDDMIREMGANARRASGKQVTWQETAGQLVKLYHSQR